VRQKIVRDYPPNYDRICRAFGVAGKRGIVFSWGDRLYVPDGDIVPAQLAAHEAVHGERQVGDIEGWWRRYMDDADFRLAEELLAHRAEYDWLMSGNRRQRRGALKATAERLAAPLYGPMCSVTEARALLRSPFLTPLELAG